MTAFNPTQYPELRNLFPELTSAQFETSLLFAFGISKKEISTLRLVSYRTVERLLDDAKAKFELASLTMLLTVFHIRLVLFALSNCGNLRSS